MGKNAKIINWIVKSYCMEIPRCIPYFYSIKHRLKFTKHRIIHHQFIHDVLGLPHLWYVFIAGPPRKSAGSSKFDVDVCIRKLVECSLATSYHVRHEESLIKCTKSLKKITWPFITVPSYYLLCTGVRIPGVAWKTSIFLPIRSMRNWSLKIWTYFFTSKIYYAKVSRLPFHGFCLFVSPIFHKWLSSTGVT